MLPAEPRGSPNPKVENRKRAEYLLNLLLLSVLSKFYVWVMKWLRILVKFISFKIQLCETTQVAMFNFEKMKRVQKSKI
jgi:hypothetical protein